MWLGSRVDFLGQTGTHVTTTAWNTMFYFFPLLSSFLVFALSLPSLPFPSPPSACRHLPLLRVASSMPRLSVLPEYVCFSPSSLSDLLASFVLCFISEVIFVSLPFCSYFFCFVLVAVLSYPVHWHFTCLTDESAIILFLVFFCLTVCDHRISVSLGYGSRTDTGRTDEAD